MSRSTELADVVAHLAEFGTVATLVTVTPDATPHVGTASVVAGAGDLELRVGSTTRSHIEANPSVTLSWLRDGNPYQLIVDGVAVVVDEPGDDGLYAVRIDVHRGILHRVAGHTAGDRCVPLS